MFQKVFKKRTYPNTESKTEKTAESPPNIKIVKMQNETK